MTMHEDNELVRDAKLAGVYDDPGFRRLIQSPLLTGPKRQKIASHLRRLVAVRCPLRHPFLPAPSMTVARAGVIPLGPTVTGRGPEYVFHLTPEDPTTGILVCAPTGRGKTLLLTRIGLTCHQGGWPTWFHDSEGDISAYVARAAPDIPIVDYADFRQELFQPLPEMNLEWGEYVSKVINSWRAPLYIGDGMANMAREVAMELYQRDGYFTPYELLDGFIRKKHRLGRREGDQNDALRNRFGGMVLPALGQVYSGGHHDLSAMLRRSIVWRLQGLSDDALSFFTTELLLAVSLMMPVGPGSRLVSLQVFDEFTRFCSLEHTRRATAGEIFMLDFARTCRKRGTGMLIATQTPHLLPPQILSNMNTMISFRPIDGRFLDCVSQAMNLNADQEEALMELPDREPRQAVVRCGGVPQPFLIEIPHYEPEWASPEELAERVEQTRQWLATIYHPPVRRRQPPPEVSSQGGSSPGPLYTPREHPISKAALDYLAACTRDWTMPVTALDEKHNISPAQGNHLRKQLAAEGLIRQHRILTGRRGGQLQIIEVTDEGSKLLERYNVPVPRPAGRGGFEHRFWQATIHQWAVKRGYPAQIEQQVAGKAVDVGVVWDEKRVAVEIVCEGIDKELGNFGKDIDAGWEQVVFCAVNQETLDRLRDLILDDLGEQVFYNDMVRFVRLSQFLDNEQADEKPNGTGQPQSGHDRDHHETSPES